MTKKNKFILKGINKLLKNYKPTFYLPTNILQIIKGHKFYLNNNLKFSK